MKSSQAQAAAAIRKELKASFPTTKFSVTSDSFSMGDAVRISYTDGPTTDKVNEIVKKYQYGHFDGMHDMYEMSNNRKDIPQSKYVQVSRSYSAEVRAEKGAQITKDWGFVAGSYDFDTRVYRALSATDFTTVAPPVAQPIAPKTEIANIEVVEYSEKAIAVFGNTKPIKEALKNIGGKFNPYLTKDGAKVAGWIFSKRHQSEVMQLIGA
jgi:hypothetical protein